MKLINLIKNELTKILHKPSLYVLFAIVIALNIFVIFIDTIAPAEVIGMATVKPNIKDYDMKNEEEVSMFIDNMTDYDVAQAARKYDFYSAEYYYIDTELVDLFRCMNEVKYGKVSEKEANECKSNFDLAMASLENYDWKNNLTNKKADLTKRLQELKEDSPTYKEDKVVLTAEIEVIDYRLKNDIYPSYKISSAELDEWIVYSQAYYSWDKEDVKYNEDELKQKEEATKNYMILKYKMDHEMIKANYNETPTDNLLRCVKSLDFFSLICLIMVAGSIISEEFNKGTIKQLLVRPYSRIKILTSKIIATLIIFLIFFFLSNGLRLIIDCIGYNSFNTLNTPVVLYNYAKETVFGMNIFSYSLLCFVSILPLYLLIMLGVLLVSIITTNNGISSAVGYMLFIASDIFILFSNNRIVSYLPITTADLNPYLFGGSSPYKYATLGSSLLVDITTFILLIGLSIFLFKKKNIKNQ